MDDHILERTSKERKNQLNLSAPLQKVANKKEKGRNFFCHRNQVANKIFNIAQLYYII